jgi:hypothetical protein
VGDISSTPFSVPVTFEAGVNFFLPGAGPNGSGDFGARFAGYEAGGSFSGMSLSFYQSASNVFGPPAMFPRTSATIQISDSMRQISASAYYHILCGPLVDCSSAGQGGSISLFIGLPEGVSLVPTELLPTPIPTALPLYAAGLGVMGMLGWRRKRKSPAV